MASLKFVLSEFGDILASGVYAWAYGWGHEKYVQHIEQVIYTGTGLSSKDLERISRMPRRVKSMIEPRMEYAVAQQDLFKKIDNLTFQLQLDRNDLRQAQEEVYRIEGMIKPKILDMESDSSVERSRN